MAIRDTQDVLIVEQPNSSAKLRDTQDVLILEVPANSIFTVASQALEICFVAT